MAWRLINNLTGSHFFLLVALKLNPPSKRRIYFNNLHIRFSSVCFYFYCEFLTHQQPHVTDSWGDEKRLSLFFGQKEALCDWSFAYCDVNLLFFKSEIIIAGLWGKTNFKSRENSGLMTRLMLLNYECKIYL